MNFETSPEKLLELIRTNPNWKDFLAQEPRFITVASCKWEDVNGKLLYPNLYMFSYNGITSDFTDEYVRICRGCIVDINDPANPMFACLPFLKFGNQGQAFCPEIDWESAFVQQKVDGILIKLFYYDNKWRWVTNNGWNTNLPADGISLLVSKYSESETDKCTSVQELIDFSINKVDLDFDNLSKNHTYMFELISPKLRILVDNPETKLVYLGCRDMTTLKELSLAKATTLVPELKKFTMVKYFPLHTMDDTLALCKSYKGDEDEGVVICDKDFNRVKIKCEDYIRLKGYRKLLSTTDEQIFCGIIQQTIDDAVQIFPEVGPKIEEIRGNIISYKKLLGYYGDLAKAHYDAINKEGLTEKEVRTQFAKWVEGLHTKYKSIFYEGIRDEPDYDRFVAKKHYREILKELEENREI